MGACKKFEILLSGYLDDELGGYSRWRVERHLAGCADCAREIAQLKSLSTLVRESEEVMGHPDLWERIRAELPAIDGELEAKGVPLWNRFMRSMENWSGSGLSPALIGSVALVVLALFTVDIGSKFEISVDSQTASPAKLGGSLPGESGWSSGNAPASHGNPAVVQGRIQSLNTQGHSVMLLQDDSDVTIIWVMDGNARQESQDEAGELL